MPLFGLGNKFSPKKAPQRKSIQCLPPEGLDDLASKGHTINLKLGNSTCIFEQGNWSCGDETINGKKAIATLRNQVQDLEEDNYMLQLKLEILLDMLTETTAENHLQSREIEKLKRK